KTVMPGVQGGPLMHVIAGKAVAFREALTPEWRAYQQQILKNAQALATALLARGLRLVSGGTDTHLVLVDLGSRGISGKDAQEARDRAWITGDKNTIPVETRSHRGPRRLPACPPAGPTRPVNEPGVDDVVADIEARLHERAEKEISSLELGDLVMENLQKLDQVAYVRFASVYRQFKDINQFMDEVRGLLKDDNKPKPLSAASKIRPIVK